MKVLMDFSLSESRAKLDAVLLAMKKSLEFEVHNALAEYERTLKVETGDTYCLVDAEGIVKTTVDAMIDKVRVVLSTPIPVMVAHWDDGADVLDLIRDAFEKGSANMENMALGDATEVYVTVPMREGGNNFEMVSLHEVLNTANAQAIDKILDDACMKVRDICIKEIVYIQEKLLKGAAW